jgi:hypothetical protein
MSGEWCTNCGCSRRLQSASYRIATSLLIFASFAGFGHAQSPLLPKPIYAKALSPGDTIMFVAPAGKLDKDRVSLAKKRLEEMGFKTRLPDNLFRKKGYLAGTDEERAAEINAAFADPEVDAVFPGTGGYGTTRIVDKLDYDVIRRNPKVLVGYSDITGLHIAISQLTGLVTFPRRSRSGDWARRRTYRRLRRSGSGGRCWQRNTLVETASKRGVTRFSRRLGRRISWSIRRSSRKCRRQRRL